MNNIQIIVLVVVIALIGMFAFQTYIRMKNRVDSEKKLFEEMQKKERREAVEKVIKERKEQFEQEQKNKDTKSEDDNKYDKDKDNNVSDETESEYSVYPDDYEYRRDNRTDDISKL